jgi:hypothetical protein
VTSTKPVLGEIVSVDLTSKTFVFKLTERVSRTIGYAAETKFETDSGASIRFDDFAAAAGGQVPIAKGDKVELIWRISLNVANPTAVTVLKKTQK